MIRRLLFRLSGNLPCRLIEIEGSPYLERYYLGNFLGVTAYLHRFVGADGDRDVHDHPWNFALALGLAGSYIEQRVTTLDAETGWQARYHHMFPGKISRLGPRVFHQIIRTEPDTWTLFVHGRRVKVWGFLRRVKEGGAVYHQPFDVASFLRWWERAPKGCEARRVSPGGAR